MISKENSLPVLNGLVLAGGRSLRMGASKGLMNWHGKEQQYYAADMLKKYCRQVFISCRSEQAGSIAPAYKSLPDSFLNMGPMGGILSALRSDPAGAWLVVACDLPLLNEAALESLIQHRDPRHIATSYQSARDGLPEPLIAIWEPHSYPVLLEFLGRHITCPRKVLMNGNVTLLTATDPSVLMNVNFPEEAAEAREMINRNGL